MDHAGYRAPRPGHPERAPQGRAAFSLIQVSGLPPRRRDYLHERRPAKALLPREGGAIREGGPPREGRPPQERRRNWVGPVPTPGIHRLPEPDQLREPRLPTHSREPRTIPVLARRCDPRLHRSVRILRRETAARDQPDRTPAAGL